MKQYVVAILATAIVGLLVVSGVPTWKIINYGVAASAIWLVWTVAATSAAFSPEGDASMPYLVVLLVGAVGLWACSGLAALAYLLLQSAHRGLYAAPQMDWDGIAFLAVTGICVAGLAIVVAWRMTQNVFRGSVGLLRLW